MNMKSALLSLTFAGIAATLFGITPAVAAPADSQGPPPAPAATAPAPQISQTRVDVGEKLQPRQEVWSANHKYVFRFCDNRYSPGVNHPDYKRNCWFELKGPNGFIWTQDTVKEGYNRTTQHAAITASGDLCAYTVTERDSVFTDWRSNTAGITARMGGGTPFLQLTNSGKLQIVVDNPARGINFVVWENGKAIDNPEVRHTYLPESKKLVAGSSDKGLVSPDGRTEVKLEQLVAKNERGSVYPAAISYWYDGRNETVIGPYVRGAEYAMLTKDGNFIIVDQWNKVAYNSNTAEALGDEAGELRVTNDHQLQIVGSESGRVVWTMNNR